MEHFVLYRPTTSDHPGEWVVRRHVVNGLIVSKDPGLTARGATREECIGVLMAAAPRVRGLHYFPASPGDDPVIEGTWL